MTNPSPRTALEAAAWKGHVDIVKVLVAHSTDVNNNNRTSSLRSPLLAAIDTAQPCVATVNVLLDAGADPNLSVESTEPSYGYPLPAAVATRNLEIVKLFIDRGANINDVHGLHSTAMKFAAGQGNPIILDYLLSNSGDVNLAMVPGEKHSITPLQQAAYDGQEAMVRKLISLGAELSVDNEEACYKNALQAASAQGHVEVVKGADLNLKGGGLFQYPLHAAAEKDLTTTVRYLIENGADVNATGGRYMTALQAAALH